LGKKKASEVCVEDTLLQAKKNDVIQLDEMWSFVWSRDNWVWVWLALCQRTRQIIAYVTGCRSAKSCALLWERIPAQYKGCQSVSDFWPVYAEIFDPLTHTQVGKHTGRTNYVERHNGVIRQRIARFARKTLRYSRCYEMHDAVVKLWVCEHNKRMAELYVI
jgi:IS1 family transposase